MDFSRLLLKSMGGILPPILLHSTQQVHQSLYPYLSISTKKGTILKKYGFFKFRAGTGFLTQEYDSLLYFRCF